MPLMEESFKNCKKAISLSKRNPITVAEIILKTNMHGKAIIGCSEWTRSLIHRSASMNQLRGVSDEHANCKRKSTGKKHKARVCDDCQNTNQKLDNY